MMERRAAPRRRLRDRLASGAGAAAPALAGHGDLQNLLALVVDDFRETALALGSIESFLGRALAVLDKQAPTREEIALLAGDERLLDRIDALAENLAALRRRMVQIAATLT
jgi:hypothetical protein